MSSASAAKPVVSVSFTTFLDFTAASTGPQRLSTVRDAKAFYEDPDPYAPRDFYLSLKVAMKSCFQAGGDRSYLDNCVRACIASRGDSYAANVEGLKRWLGRKKLTEVAHVPPQLWTGGGLAVKVNPEFGGMIGRKPSIVKLYVKDKPITKRQIDVALRMLQITHERQGDVGIRDVRRAKLHQITCKVPNIDVILENDAVSLAHLWSSV